MDRVMSGSTLPQYLASLDKLRTTEDGHRISWREDAPFSDWVLSWGDLKDQNVHSYKVHRVILVGGTRPAHYFAGAVQHEDFTSGGGTDLSLLLPEECKLVFDQALDFMYGIDLPHMEPEHAALLFKVADVLQCPTLRNACVEEVKRLVGAETAASDNAAAHMLVKATQLGNTEISSILLEYASAEALREAAFLMMRLAPNQLSAVVPACMDRACNALGACWGGIEHEGGAVRMDGREIVFTGGGTCIAWTQGDARAGRHTWRVRVDEVDNSSGFIALGVVVGPKDKPRLGDMDTWKHWYLYYSDDGKKRHKGAHDLLEYHEPFPPGSVITIILDLEKGTLEFEKDSRPCGVAYDNLGPGSYHVGTELGNSASCMKITLLNYEFTAPMSRRK